MKHLSLVATFSFSFLTLFATLQAQAPSAIPYQAVARNSSGNLIASQSISLRFSIHDGSAMGTIVYRETHAALTNALGLFTVNIGQGTPVTGTFAGINWASGSKFMQVELDPAGGTSYTDMGTQQMLSVPYALYANSGGTPPTAGTGINISGTTITNTAPTQWNNNGSDISFSSGNVGIGTTSPSSILDIQGSVQRLLKLRGSNALGTWLTLDNGGFEWNLVTTGTGNGEGVSNLLVRDPLGVRLIIKPYSGYVGLGTDNPTQKLEVVGTTKTTGFQMTNGAAAGYLLKSDAAGNASWVAPTTYNGGTGINVTGTTITNTAPDQTVTLTGTGATTVTGTYPNFTVNSTDNNTTYTGGTGIDVTGTTITNTAPDQTVTLTGTGATTVTGTYPNFTVNSTDNNTTYTGGTGIDVTGTTITNTVPDQTVTLTGSGIANITGTYPNFTISASETDPKVGALTSNQVPKWNGAMLSDGIITDNGSNIGIGTTNPGYRFTLQGTSNEIYSVWSEDGTQSANNFSWQIAPGDGTSTSRIGYFLGSFGNNSGFLIGNTADAPLRFGVGSGSPEWMRITSSGRVGIGTISPTEKLDVNGKTKTTTFQMTNGATTGYVLQSDAAGNASWVAPTTYNGGTGINVTGTTITNTAPDQTVTLTGSGGTTISGTYPNFTVSSTTTGTAYTGGTGIDVTGTTITNTSPDQTVTLTGTGGATVTGTYPNFTINSSNYWSASGNNINNTNSGNIGIGTTSPSQKLHIVGSGLIESGKLRFSNTAKSVYIGDAAGSADPLSGNTRNVGIGYQALNSNTTGAGNTAIGYISLYSNVSGNSNTAIGFNNLFNNIDGLWNTAIGQQALASNTSGSYNTCVGGAALTNNLTGIHNVAIGYAAGDNSLGDGNVFIGYQAGYNETGSNKLYIDNSNDSSPLIGGDFASDYVNINGNLGVGTTPVNKLDIEGGLAVGATYAGTSAAPSNGAIIQGNVGIGTTTTANKLDIEGGLAVGASYSGTSTAPSNGAIIQGNVGIGTNNPMKQFSNTDTNIWGSNVYGGATKALLWRASDEGYTMALYNSSSNGFAHGLAVKITGTAYTNRILDLCTGSTSDATGTTVMVVKGDGTVGIGTAATNQAILVVSGSQSNEISSYGYLNSNGNTNTSGGINYYSIYASDRMAASEFNAFSDARIKNILGVSDSRADLQTLMGIQITNYKLKDHISKGDREYKKVIAQQVEEVYPQAVTKMKDVVPDIYQLADIHEGYISLANTLKQGDIVKLIFGERTEVVDVISTDAHGFKVNLPDEGKVFVYGRQVDDFRTVDYEALSTLNISATQELVKMIQHLEAENQSMKSDINQIKTALQQLGAGSTAAVPTGKD